MTPASRATGATSAALATPQPPSLIGRVVYTHAASHVGVPNTASHVACWAAKTTVWRRGKVRRAYYVGGRHLSTCAGELPLQRSQVGPHRRVIEVGVDRYPQHLRALLQVNACPGC